MKQPKVEFIFEEISETIKTPASIVWSFEGSWHVTIYVHGRNPYYYKTIQPPTIKNCRYFLNKAKIRADIERYTQEQKGQ